MEIGNDVFPSTLCTTLEYGAQSPWNIIDGISHPNKLADPSHVGFFGSAEDPSTSFKFYIFTPVLFSLLSS